MSAPMSPASSASPTPSIATRMIPTTPKLLKLATGDVNMNRMPSAVRRPLTAVVSVSTWRSSSSVVEGGRDERDLDRAAGRIALLADDGRRLDHLVGDARPDDVQDLGEDDHSRRSG